MTVHHHRHTADHYYIDTSIWSSMLKHLAALLCLVSLCLRHLFKSVLWSVTVGQGFRLGSLSWAPIISLTVCRMWGDLIGWSAGVKHLASTWTESSLTEGLSGCRAQPVTQHWAQCALVISAHCIGQITLSICITKVHLSVPNCILKKSLWSVLCNFKVNHWDLLKKNKIITELIFVSESRDFSLHFWSDKSL